MFVMEETYVIKRHTESQWNTYIYMPEIKLQNNSYKSSGFRAVSVLMTITINRHLLH